MEESQTIIEPGAATLESGLGASPQNPTQASDPLKRFFSLLLDLVTGFCSLIVLAVVLVILHRIARQAFVPLTCGLFFIAAMTKAIWSELNPWAEGVAISLGAFFPVALVTVAAGHGGARLLGFGLGLALVCGAGAQTQKLFASQHRLAGFSTAVAFLALLMMANRLVVPMLMSLGQRTMNEPAPPFTVTTLDGSRVTRDSLKGRVVVLDFWGTWCEPCMAEMPAILKVHRHYQANSDVAFFAVNAGWHDDTADKVRAFVDRKHLDIPVALNPAGATKLLEVNALPTLILIDRRGNIRMESVGYDPDVPLETQLSSKIDELLAAGR